MRLPPLRRSICLALSLACAMSSLAGAQDSTSTVEERMRQLLAPVLAAGQTRDSLAALADKASGDASVMLEEQVWQQQLVFQSRLVSATDELEKLRKAGTDLSPARAMIAGAIKAGWPRYLRQIERREPVMAAMIEKRNAATPSQRLLIENEISEYSDRTARMFSDLVDAVKAIEHLGVDVSTQRAYMVEKLQGVAAQTSARLVVLARTERLAAANVQRAPSDNAARVDLDAINESLDRAKRNLATEISLLNELGSDAT